MVVACLGSGKRAPWMHFGFHTTTYLLGDLQVLSPLPPKVRLCLAFLKNTVEPVWAE